MESSPDGRKARGAKTRERILEATMEIVCTEGVPAATQRAVAGRAGVSLASVTYHFRTVDDLLVAAFTVTGQRTIAALGALREAVVAGDLGLIDAAMSLAGQRPYGQQLAPDGVLELSFAAFRNPALREPATGFIEAMAAQFEPFVDPPGAAAALARSLTGLLLHEVIRAPTEPSGTFRDDVTRLFDAFGVSRGVDRWRKINSAESADSAKGPS